MSDHRLDRRAMGLGLASLALGPPPAPAAGEGGADLRTDTDSAGRILVPVRLNGQGPFDFVVDTGANRTVVASEIAAALGLPDAGPAQIHGVAGVEAARKVAVGLLQVDGVAVRDLAAPVLSRARMGADGLLGVDVLKGRLVTMDFRRNALRIEPARGRGPVSALDIREGAARRSEFGGPGVAVPARYRFGQLIIITADASGRRVTAFMDSGSDNTVGNLALRRRVAGEGDPTAPRYVAPVFSATGQTAQAEVAILPALRLGGLSILELTTAFADLHVFDIWDLAAEPSLLIGVDVMSLFNAVQLDYGGRQVIFYPREPLRRAPRTPASS